jgi:hypothetical protein
MTAMSDWTEAEIQQPLRSITSQTADSLQGYCNPEIIRCAVDAKDNGTQHWATISCTALDADTILGVNRGTGFDATTAAIIARIRSDYSAASDVEAQRRLAAFVAEIIYPDLMGA